MKNTFHGTGEYGYNPGRKVLTVFSGLRYAGLANLVCHFVEEHHNEKIKIIKDIATAVVGISIVVWTVVSSVEVTEMWSQLRRQ